MTPVDPLAVAALVLILVCVGGYGLYERSQIRRLDRIIAEKEAAMNAPDQAPSTTR